jgi:hypothetical protein
MQTENLKDCRQRYSFSLLSLNFKLRLSDFGIILPQSWGDEITIQIYQALLKTNE